MLGLFIRGAKICRSIKWSVTIAAHAFILPGQKWYKPCIPHSQIQKQLHFCLQIISLWAKLAELIDTRRDLHSYDKTQTHISDITQLQTCKPGSDVSNLSYIDLSQVHWYSFLPQNIYVYPKLAKSRDTWWSSEYL